MPFAQETAGLIPPEFLEPSLWLSQHRHAWYALPIVTLMFIVLAFVPVTLLITATGLTFGPILGPIYAMAGCLASASTYFAIGRRLGHARIARYGGKPVSRVSRALKRNGIIAVFFVRKIPAPFALVNVVIGASTIRYRDFVIGTVLGMGAFVIALAGLGYQLTEALRNPSPETIATGVVVVGVPLLFAWWLNRMLRRSEPQT
ncbi:MAG TPA: VTT domain-containing protein [Vicinamibacterales bacterium]|nr:VTT domain-containing protein [Vicinamibacterales bacterium]